MNKQNLRISAIVTLAIAEQYQNIYSDAEVRKAFVISALTAENSKITITDIKSAIVQANQFLGKVIK